MAKVIHSWNLSKYAATLSQKSNYLNKTNVSTNSTSQTFQQNSHQWLNKVSKVLGDLKICFTSAHHLIVVHGEEMLDCFSLFGATKWIRCLRKGDSLLFEVKCEQDLYRFRIKFEQCDSTTSLMCCMACVNVLRQYMVVLDGSENTDHLSDLGDDVPDVVGSQALAGFIMDSRSSLPALYNRSRIPVKHLDDLVRLALTDTNFPAFVKDVETVLNQLISE